MKYSCDVIINRPRDEVIAKFDSTENLYKWQPSLESFEHVSGEPAQVGGVSKLTYGGKRTMTMKETITAREFPDSFDATYEAPGVVNPCHNVFEDLGDGDHEVDHGNRVHLHRFHEGRLEAHGWCVPERDPVDDGQVQGVDREYVESSTPPDCPKG